ncbi:hypothetical protein KCU65_g3287, partial [Aureobasidium melanogenum]
MASRNVPSHIGSSRTLAPADATSTPDAMKDSQPLSFSTVQVSIDNHESCGDNRNSHTPNPPAQSQSGRQKLHPTSAISRDAPKTPRARSRLHASIFDRSIARHVRPMGPARSNSAFEYRQTWGGHVEHMHDVDSLIPRAPRPWSGVGDYLCWPGPLAHPFSLVMTAWENTLVFSTEPRAPSISNLRPGRNNSRLVSLAEIATRFRVEQGAIQTLNATVEKPDVLKFIVLFNNYENGNYGCNRKLAISAKVNLHLLPGCELPYPDQDAGELEHEHNDPSNAFPDSGLIDLRSPTVSAASKRAEVASSSSCASNPSASTQPDRPRSLGDATETSNLQPIAVFSKVQSASQPKEFEFLGWYELEETEFFAPGSFDLIKMLKQKSGRALKEDLETEWAKIKLVRQGRSDNAGLDEL